MSAAATATAAPLETRDVNLINEKSESVVTTAIINPPASSAKASTADVSAISETAPTTTTTTTTTTTLAPEIPLVKVTTALVHEEAKTGKKLVPFLAPLPSSKPAPAPPLTPEHEAQYVQLLAHCEAIKTLPSSNEKGAQSRALDEAERMWLTRECLLRYLRASKWDLAAAKKRVESTIVWRREYGVAEHTAEYLSIENETGKQVIMGFDNEARPCLYLNPARQNTERSPRQIHHLVFMLERVVDLMPAGQENLALLIDFNSSTKSSNPSLSQGREVMNILQNHYPERLGRALVINIPWFVWGFFKLINPFIDPLTREKLKFNVNMRDHIPPAQLLKDFGGDVDFAYDHSKYWTELVRLAGEKRSQYIARWKASGSKIGASEFDLRGGAEVLAAEIQNMQLKN